MSIFRRITLFRLAFTPYLLWLLVVGLTVSGCSPTTKAITVKATTATTPTAKAATILLATVTPTTEAENGLAAWLNRAIPTSKAKSARPAANASVTATRPTTRTNSITALLPTVTPTPRVTPTRTPGPPLKASINAASVNVRGGPGTNYPIVAKALAGAAMDVNGRTESGDWLRVCCPAGKNVEGWISAEFLEVEMPNSSSLLALAVPEMPTPPPGSDEGNKSAADLAAATAPGMPGPGSFPAVGNSDPLTGQALPAGRSAGRPIIVCVNNDYAARPQLGFGQADVIYEYLMEGYGITRFSAIFYGSEAGQVGPVRSARLINYYMGALYDAGLVCSGASDPVRYSLKHEAPFPYMDIDLDDGSNVRYSVSIGTDYRTRLRTDTTKLRRWLADWGVDKAPWLRGFSFGNLPKGGVPATSIDIPYPTYTGCQVSYQYDPASGRYLRWMGGEAHLDGNTGAQLAVENVIVQVVTHEDTNIVEDNLGSTSIRLNLFGSGQAILFRDGQAFPATWRSDARGDTPHFFDLQGHELALKAGKSFISVIPDSYLVDYQ